MSGIAVGATVIVGSTGKKGTVRFVGETKVSSTLQFFLAEVKMRYDVEMRH